MFNRRRRNEADVQEWSDVAVWLSDVIDAVERDTEDDAAATVRFFPEASVSP
ncbi:MAG: hypothetical protein NVS3B21_23290 [Acidimicrobiales bacterium]